jgi:hypothetical protein
MSKMSDSSPHPLRPRRRAVRATVAVAAVFALAAAGCGDDDSTATGSGSGGGSGGGSGDDLSIDVVSPEDGATVGDTFEVEVDTSVDIGEPDTGLHHVHLYYDGNETEGEYDLVYDPTFTVERDLSPGEHTVDAVIANADHSLTDARDEFTINVEGDAAGSGGGGTGTTDTTEPTTAEDDGGDDY